MFKLALFLFGSLCAQPIEDYLKTDFSIEKLDLYHIEAACIIRLQENDPIQELQKELEKFHVKAPEYNEYRFLSNELLQTFCTNVISPYLLTQTLSHLSLYQSALNQNVKTLLVMEGNAHVVQDLAKIDKSLQELVQIDPNWDIFYTDVDFRHRETGEYVVPKLEEFPKNKVRLSDDISQVAIRYGTASFVLSHSGMQKILEYYKTHSLIYPFDQTLFKIPNLRIYGANCDIISNRFEMKKEEQLAQEKKLPVFATGVQMWIDPKMLLTHDRFDAICKYIYAKYYLSGYTTNWHIELYKKHLEKWIHFYNVDPLKVGPDAFIASYNALLDSLQKKQYDETNPIPVNNLGLAHNGSHRIGASLFLNIPVKATVIAGKDSPNMTAENFKNKYLLGEEYLDAMALEYAKLQPDTYIVTLFPLGRDFEKKAEEILRSDGTIVYKKEIHLKNEIATLEFIRLIYTSEWWTGSFQDNFKHARAKANLCFPSKTPTLVYLFQCPSEKRARALKEKVRKECGLGNEVIHINDHHEQTVIIAKSLFNQNSIDFLNEKKLTFLPNFEKYFEKLKQKILEEKIDPDLVCIDTSAVMSAYGLRDCEDLDLLHKEPFKKIMEMEGIDSHNRYLECHVTSLDDLLFNPRNHFYYQGIKFVSLDMVRKMKRKRASLKDFKDVQTIQRFKKNP